MTKDEIVGIGQRIKYARESKGLSQNEMADEFGISLRHYNRIEQGESQITPQHLVKTKFLTGIGIDFLVTGEIPNEINSPLIAKLNSVPPFQRQKMMQILELIMEIISDRNINDA